jgi:hypothetical protein
MLPSAAIHYFISFSVKIPENVSCQSVSEPNPNDASTLARSLFKQSSFYILSISRFLWLFHPGQKRMGRDIYPYYKRHGDVIVGELEGRFFRILPKNG